MKRGTIKVFSIFIFLILASLALLVPEHSLSASRKPLFIQVHVTNSLGNISSAQLKRILAGEVANFRDIGGRNMPVRIYVDSEIAKKVIKEYPGLNCRVQSFNREYLASERGFLGISDLRGLRPCFKVLYIDKTLPWGKIGDDYSLENDGPYAFTMNGAEEWDPGSHVTIAQTGVTAMTRAFMAAVEKSGDILSPVRFTKTITSKADIATTSNEVSFLEPCTWPLKDRMLFCSPIRYLKILEESGFDVIELTGNHNNDFGSVHNAESVSLLDRAGMKHFGGGKNRDDAEKVLYLTVKGTTVAFVGFNELGPEYAFATEKKAGAARLSRELFTRLVGEAVSKASVVFATVQWGNENDPVPQEIQKRYFHLAADLGATIIVSSSAHRPMGLEFYKGRFISYGLGNFLFDQMQTMNTRRGLIARHHIYKGKHITTELIPYLIYDYSQPRLLHGKEARELFEEVFKYSIGPAFK
ncbi:MAG TPA: CapA family protein [Spirochaetota bacterium]|nr:CapA family protein [Spirochaetota bacterium]